MEITVQDLKKMIDNHEKFILIDCRTDGEVENGMITGAKHIEMHEIESQIDSLPKDKEIVIYCHSGGRSAYLVNILQSKGFNVKNLMGGIRAWKREIQ